MKNHAVSAAAEATVIAVTSQITKASGITGAVAWLASNGYVAVAGVFLAAVSLVLNIYFQWKRDRRENREFERRMVLMKSQPSDLENTP